MAIYTLVFLFVLLAFSFTIFKFKYFFFSFLLQLAFFTSRKVKAMEELTWVSDAGSCQLDLHLNLPDSG